MISIDKKKCLVIASTEISLKIESFLKEKYSIICKMSIERSFPDLRNYLISCIIIYVNSSFLKSPVDLFRLKQQFPAIPAIALVNDHNLNIAQLCGEGGIDFVVSVTDMQKLTEIIQIAVCMKNSRVSLAEIGIDLNQCSPQVLKVVKIIEKMYLRLTSVKEVSDLMGISEWTLSKYFKRCCPIRPKQLIAHLKIKHSANLMKNPGLSLKEIARLVGYSNQSRFNECFHRIMVVSPSEYRNMAKKT